ncbi:MAG: hypothetical protein CBE14_000685 [Rickettsiales bacterium TMED254]|nr:MAG: hypothetical protein CBE14_000685 [Rickettsiales bacterium TMED254]
MKDYLQDIVQHTHGLGFIDLVKIEGTDKETKLEGLAEDRSVIVKATFKNPTAEFMGTFGMPNLNKLDLLLKIPVYKDNAKLEIQKQERNGDEVPVGIHFENDTGDFKNDYRFMTSEIISEKLKSVKFKGVEWNVTVMPTVASIQRLAYQSQVHAEETTFVAKTDGTDLKFYFGDHSTHAGDFVFESSVEGKLTQGWAWPVQQIQAILKLSGDKTMMFSDQGAAQIVVDSGLAVYEYILPAQSK